MKLYNIVIAVACLAPFGSAWRDSGDCEDKNCLHTLLSILGEAGGAMFGQCTPPQNARKTVAELCYKKYKDGELDLEGCGRAAQMLHTYSKYIEGFMDALCDDCPLLGHVETCGHQWGMETFEDCQKLQKGISCITEAVKADSDCRDSLKENLKAVTTLKDYVKFQLNCKGDFKRDLHVPMHELEDLLEDDDF